MSFKDVLQRPNIGQFKTEARMEVKSTAMARRDDWIPTANPVIRWPGEAGTLAAIIPDLLRLNPHRDLRLLRQVDEDGEFLRYAGSALDVLTIALPKPFSDQFMSDLTDSNKDWVGYQTDTGVVRVGPRRFERTSSGDLLLRPKSRATVEACTSFNSRYHGHMPNSSEQMPADQVGRIQKYWAIFHDPHEMWEVEYGYMPEDLFDRVGERTDEEYWRTTPIGTISYIDQYDLAIDEHDRRAREIVNAGSDFAIIGDMRTGELRIFRADGVQSSFDDIRLPEMPWFEVPAPKRSR